MSQCYIGIEDPQRWFGRRDRAEINACSPWANGDVCHLQCRRELGDNEGALADLVKAFVLHGSALNGSADGGEAQAIEDVSREACRARAG